MLIKQALSFKQGLEHGRATEQYVWAVVTFRYNFPLLDEDGNLLPSS